MRFFAEKLVYAVLLAIVCAGLASPLHSSAQPLVQPPKPAGERPGEKPAVGATAEPAEGGIREAKPETFYLIDKDGKLVPFFDIPFEEFRRLYLLDRKLKAPDQPPRCSLQQVVVSGTVEGAVATLDVSVRIVLNESGWTRVPLRLHGAVLVKDESAKADAARQFVEFDKSEGYSLWVQGESGSTVSAALKMLATVESFASESRMLLQAPRGPGAELRLKVPTPNAVVDQLEGAIPQPSRKLPDGRTELRLLGLSGDVAIVWRESRELTAKPQPVFEASGNTLIRFEGQSHVSAEARLKVRALNGPIDTFQVRLPTGMKLIPVSQARYTATVLPPKSSTKSPAEEAQTVEIKLTNKTSEPIEITLLAEMAREPSVGEKTWETRGFEVAGAIGQWGYIDLAVEGDWSLVWTEGPFVQRVGEPSDPAAKQPIVARFEYSRQPFSLLAQVLPKRTRVSVEPMYVLQIEPQQARLEARLKYRIRGAKVYHLEIDLTGWKVDLSSLAPANLLQIDSVSTENDSPLRLPLAAAAQTAGGEFELRFMATREIKPGEAFSLTLPRPKASTLTPAGVVVLPADNVELTPLPGGIEGLVGEALPPLVKLPIRQQTPLFYRDRSEESAAVFAGQYKVHRGALAVASTSRLRFEERIIQVEEKFLYRISFEPRSELFVDVPRSVTAAGSVTFALDGEPLNSLPVAPENPDDLAAGHERLRLDLRGPRIGACEIVASYVLPSPTPEAGKSVEFEVPLIIPAVSDDAAVGSNILTVMGSSAARLEPDDEAWSDYEDGGPPEDVDGFQVTAPADTPSFALRATLLSGQKRGSAKVRQFWLQTWLSASDRRDRAVFRLATSESRARLVLPAGARTSDLDVAVDGRRVEPRLTSSGEIDVELPAAQGQRETVIEIWYSFDAGRPATGGFSFGTPSVSGATAVSRMYWQLVTPRNEHLIVAPSDMTAELVWRWEGLNWGRQALLSQSELEKWIDASPQSPLPDEVNTYLYSSFSAQPSIAVHTAPRALIVLVVSGVVLLFGLAWLYLPVLRHPAVLLVAAAAVLAGLIFDPAPAMQFAQAAAVGVSLALAARLLHWMLSRRRERRLVVHGASLLGLDSAVSDSRPSRRDVDSRISTATAQLAIPASAEMRP